MSTFTSSALRQRHAALCESLTQLYNLVKARKTKEQQEITFSYIEGWLKTDLVYLQQLLTPQYFNRKQ